MGGWERGIVKEMWKRNKRVKEEVKGGEGEKEVEKKQLMEG